MKSPLLLRPRRLPLAASLLLLHVLPLAAQPAATPAAPAPNGSSPAPARGQAVGDLPRVKSRGRPGEVAPVAKGKVIVDELAPQGASGGKVAIRQNLVCLTLDSGTTWSRPLRGLATGTSFVSFLAYGAVGTTLDIGGARLAIGPSAKPGYAQITLGAPGTTLGPSSSFPDHVKIETHNGAPLAALPLLTVRLDPTAGVWDLYIFQRLVAEDIPLADSKGARQFTLQPGAQGAWLLNLTLSDENPLFVDANANGIDDTFEKTKRGGTLLAANATAADRKTLATEWKSAQSAANVPAWKIRRPVPDEAVAAAARK